MTSTNLPQTPQKQALTLFFGGLLPVIVFTIIEDQYGVVAGLMAALSFGFAEIIYEWIRYKKLSTFTLIGNGLIVILGLISLLAQDGIWFKLQPALFEFGFFIFLIASWFLKKPFLKMLAEKQNPQIPDVLKNRLSAMTFRLSLFMLFHGILATWAAFYWSTEAWALLKGLGLTLSLILLMGLEILMARRKQLH